MNILCWLTLYFADFIHSTEEEEDDDDAEEADNGTCCNIYIYS